MLRAFREFAMRGSVVDLAIGGVLGAAFGAIVNSLVTDIISFAMSRRATRCPYCTSEPRPE